LTSQTALDRYDLPLLLVHLLEWMGVEYTLDVEQFNRCWLEADETTSWSQLIIEHTADAAEIVRHAPASGIWRMGPDGTLLFRQPAFQPQAVADEAEAFFLRTVDRDDVAARGQCLGRLLVRGRLLTDDHQLTERANRWISAFRALFAAPHTAHDLYSVAQHVR
jgi:hypothetical protein